MIFASPSRAAASLVLAALFAVAAKAQAVNSTATGATADVHVGSATPAKKLADPPASAIPGIIQKFAAKERLFRELLRHYYTYTEKIKVETLDDDGTPSGSYIQTNDIQYTPDGQRQIVCTYCPQPNLKNVEVTQEDINDYFNMDMYTISVDELDQYNVRYVDHEPLDELTTYVFDISPKRIEKGHRYFQGKIWVDDHDLQIVKSFGKAVPDIIGKHGEEDNIFLPFETYRQPIDKKYWFPVYTFTDSKVGEQRVRIVIHFEDYKQFRSTTRILETEELPQNPAPQQHNNQSVKR